MWETLKLVSYIAFSKYMRTTYEKAFSFCCADSCLQWRSEPFSDLPLSNNCSKCCKGCQLSIHLAVNVSLTLAPLNSVKKTHSLMEEEQATTSIPQSKIDLSVHFLQSVALDHIYIYPLINSLS